MHAYASSKERVPQFSYPKRQRIWNIVSQLVINYLAKNSIKDVNFFGLLGHIRYLTSTLPVFGQKRTGDTLMAETVISDAHKSMVMRHWTVQRPTILQKAENLLDFYLALQHEITIENDTPDSPLPALLPQIITQTDARMRAQDPLAVGRKILIIRGPHASGNYFISTLYTNGSNLFYSRQYCLEVTDEGTVQTCLGLLYAEYISTPSPIDSTIPDVTSRILKVSHYYPFDSKTKKLREMYLYLESEGLALNKTDYIQKLAEFAYMFANIMPYKRGSSSICEWMMRGLAQKKGLKLGPFNHEITIGWDWLSFVTTFSDYSKVFPKLFTAIEELPVAKEQTECTAHHRFFPQPKPTESTDKAKEITTPANERVVKPG